MEADSVLDDYFLIDLWEILLAFLDYLIKIESNGTFFMRDIQFCNVSTLF